MYTTFALFFSPLHAEKILPRSGFFADVSFLYRQTHSNDLTFSLVKEESSSRTFAKNIDFEWDVGFKAGMGYRVPHDLWELALNFTSLQTHADREIKAKEGQVLLPSWSMQDAFFCGSKAHWRLHLGILDFLLFRKISSSDRFTFSPLIGISTAWIRQKFNVGYFGCDDVAIYDTLIRMKNKFWGIGAYCGLLTKWQLSKNFSLFAQTDWRLLYGEFYLHQDEDLTLSKEKILGIHNIFRLSASIFEAEMGLMWEHYFSRGLKRIQIRCSWDELILFSQNQLMHFVDQNAKGDFISNQGDLALRGLEVSFRFDF